MKIRFSPFMIFGILLIVGFLGFGALQLNDGDMSEMIDKSLGIKDRGLLTGFVVGNESDEVSVNYTREMAEDAIKKSKEIISDMEEHGFNVIYVNDRLAEAELVFDQAYFADILRDSSNVVDRARATNALKLVDWEDIDYGDVIVLTEEIRSRRERALLLEDLIKVRRAEVLEDDEGSKTLLEEVEIAFREERYEDTDELLVLLRDSIEKNKEGDSFGSSLKDGAKNFVQRYWIAILLVLILLSGGSYYSNKKIRKRLLKKKIAKMKQERNVLVSLIKKTQIERYKDNSISGLVYNIRVKKYKDRLHRIDQELPVLRSRLGVISNSKRVKNSREVK